MKLRIYYVERSYGITSLLLYKIKLLNNACSDTNTTDVQNGCHVPSGTYMKAFGTQNCF